MPRALALAVLAGMGAAGAASCSAFSLDDVVPARDGGNPEPDAQPTDARAEASGDGGGNADSSVDAASDGEGGPACDADPCSCLSPATLTSGGGSVAALRLSGGYAYFAAGGPTKIYRVSLSSFDGGAPELVGTPTSWGSDGDFAVGGSFIYFVDGNSNPVLARIPADGGSAQLLGASLPLLPLELTVGPAGLYWADALGEVCRASLDGGIPPGDSGCGGGALSPPVAGANSNTHIALTDGGIWLGLNKQGALRRIPYSGGSGKLVASVNLTSPLSATDTDVFFYTSHVGSFDAGVIFHELASGSGPTEVTRPDFVQTIAIDGTNVYFISGNTTISNRYVWEVSWSGAGLKLLGCDDQQPAVLAVDDTYVYWGNAGNGAIKRVAK